MTNKNLSNGIILGIIVIFFFFFLWVDHRKGEQKFIVGLETKKLVFESDLNTTNKNRFLGGDDISELKFGDTVILETIETIVPNYNNTKVFNVYYEDRYDVSDIVAGIHLKLNQINHLEKAVVMPILSARATQVKK